MKNCKKGLFHIIGATFLVFYLTACTHSIAFHELHYDLQNNKNKENIIVVINKNTIEKTVSIRSATTGIIHQWDAKPGEMLKQVADIEFPQLYNDYIYSSSMIEPPWKENTIQLWMTIPEYEFKNHHAHFTIKIAIYDENSKLFEKKYKEEGITQGAKMFWAGAFGMKSAIRQSSLDALKKIFKQMRTDLSSLLELEPLKSNDDFNNYYSPQDSVDSFDEGDYEYYSPLNSSKTNGKNSEY